MTKIALTEKATNVLNAIADGCTTREAVAEALMVSIPTINGSLTALKRNQLINVADNGDLSLTKAASEYVTVAQPKGQSGSDAGEAGSKAHSEGSKMESARKLFEKLVGQGKARKEVIQSFQSEIGLTKAGAATYYQTLRHEHGMVQSITGNKGNTNQKGQ